MPWGSASDAAATSQLHKIHQETNFGASLPRRQRRRNRRGERTGSGLCMVAFFVVSSLRATLEILPPRCQVALRAGAIVIVPLCSSGFEVLATVRGALRRADVIVLTTHGERGVETRKVSTRLRRDDSGSIEPLGGRGLGSVDALWERQAGSRAEFGGTAEARWRQWWRLRTAWENREGRAEDVREGCSALERGCVGRLEGGLLLGGGVETARCYGNASTRFAQAWRTG